MSRADRPRHRVAPLPWHVAALDALARVAPPAGPGVAVLTPNPGPVPAPRTEQDDDDPLVNLAALMNGSTITVDVDPRPYVT